MQALTVIFIGPQGSGKGTQVDMLKEQLSAIGEFRPITHIQTGKPFRELAAQGGYTAGLVKDLVENGKFVPNILTNSFVVQEFVKMHEADAHVLFDGYPRDIEQARFCEDIFTLYSREKVSVIYLDTPEDVVTERMLKRGRTDDTEETIKERLRQYKAVTEPLVQYYESRPNTVVHRISGASDVDTVKYAISSALGIV